MIRNAWYPVAACGDLGRKPLARMLLGEPLVLFRTPEGTAVALPDRCSHRHAPLSAGRLEGGCVVCPYHGWRFDGAGRCASIPALEPGTPVPPAAHLEPHPVAEKAGYVWVFMGDQAPGPLPWAFPELERPGVKVSRLEAVIEAPYADCVENFIDTTHTAYIHGGLFRSPDPKPAFQSVKATASGVTIDYEESTDKKGSFLSGLLVKDGITHQDRFILPAIVRVAYGFGPDRGVTGFQFLTPETASRTRLFALTIAELGALGPLFTLGVPFVGKAIMEQDRRILEAQAPRRQPGGVSVPADAGIQWIRQAIARAEAGEPPAPEKTARVAYRL